MPKILIFFLLMVSEVLFAPFAYSQFYNPGYAFRRCGINGFLHNCSGSYSSPVDACQSDTVQYGSGGGTICGTADFAWRCKNGSTTTQIVCRASVGGGTPSNSTCSQNNTLCTCNAGYKEETVDGVTSCVLDIDPDPEPEPDPRPPEECEDGKPFNDSDTPFAVGSDESNEICLHDESKSNGCVYNISASVRSYGSSGMERYVYPGSQTGATCKLDADPESEERGTGVAPSDFICTECLQCFEQGRAFYIENNKVRCVQADSPRANDSVETDNRTETRKHSNGGQTTNSASGGSVTSNSSGGSPGGQPSGMESYSHAEFCEEFPFSTLCSSLDEIYWTPGSSDGLFPDIDDEVLAARSSLTDMTNDIKDYINSVFSVSVPYEGALPCDSVNLGVLGNFEICLSDYADQLNLIGQIMLMIGSLIALFIILS